MTTGTIEDETFTMDNHGMTFVYLLSGQIDVSMKFDQARECDESTARTGIIKAQAGVFDDFNAGLLIGRDHDGIPIGFFTFSDSNNSVVTISTTSYQP